MAYNQTIHMTPGNDADCYLPGCTGVEGGLCIGVTDGDAQDTLWWCCPPYAPCRGGAQTACEYVNNSTTEVAEDQMRCTFDSQYYWCCSSAHEECPPTTALISSCNPRGFQNPALYGPVWGPNANTTNTTTTNTNTTTTASTISSSAISSVSLTSLPSSATAPPASSGSSGLSAGGAAGVGIAAFALLLSAGIGAYFVRRRRVAGKVEKEDRPLEDPPVVVEMASGQLPQEIQGQAVHELDSGWRMSKGK